MYRRRDVEIHLDPLAHGKVERLGGQRREVAPLYSDGVEPLQGSEERVEAEGIAECRPGRDAEGVDQKDRNAPYGEAGLSGEDPTSDRLPRHGGGRGRTDEQGGDGRETPQGCTPAAREEAGQAGGLACHGVLSEPGVTSAVGTLTAARWKLGIANIGPHAGQASVCFQMDQPR